jgi:hypothetical protein
VRQEIRVTAGKAWAFRHWVERDAQARFLRLAGRLERIGTPASLVAKAHEASEDEGRHAELCGDLASRYRHPLLPSEGAPREIAPSRLSSRQKVLYEVAAFCLAETESSVMLVTLIKHARNEKMRKLLRELSRDEVVHARLGWAVLASHKSTDDLSFLARWIPWMLTTTAGDTFKRNAAGPEDPALTEHGVLPYSLRRRVFIDALEDVIFPGLEALAVDATASRAWLAKLVSSASVSQTDS